MNKHLCLTVMASLALAACGADDTGQDGISAEDAKALDEAAEKLDRQAEPAENAPRS